MSEESFGDDGRVASFRHREGELEFPSLLVGRGVEVVWLRLRRCQVCWKDDGVSWSCLEVLVEGRKPGKVRLGYAFCGEGFFERGELQAGVECGLAWGVQDLREDLFFLCGEVYGEEQGSCGVVHGEESFGVDGCSEECLEGLVPEVALVHVRVDLSEVRWDAEVGFLPAVGGGVFGDDVGEDPVRDLECVELVPMCGDAAFLVFDGFRL